jgi:hypothetical protein
MSARLRHQCGFRVAKALLAGDKPAAREESERDEHQDSRDEKNHPKTNREQSIGYLR